jgi:radical SAM superfamily enzyme YgiQ (UPF0313 family)
VSATRPSKRFRLTLIHPCIGRRPGQKYIRSWQMEPLPPAVVAGLTPKDVDVKFYDDRMEEIPFDEPTDLVALSIETYTAKRSYQIATEYRQRGVPVVMGGFHATLRTAEVMEYAESVVVGEAEDVWAELIDDYRAGTAKKLYKAKERPALAGHFPDRRIFEGKRYLPVGLVEVGRGCHFHCEFCAVQTVFSRRQTRRSPGDVFSELERVKARGDRNLIFFVDDNITSNMKQAKEFFKELKKLDLRWVSQASINAAHDEDFLHLIKDSGCRGVLIGFESLNEENLAAMDKGFNTMKGGFEVALANLRKHGIRLYSTFVFGYDGDKKESFHTTVEFAKRHRFYIAAFNHLTPFPGTPLYERLEKEGRLLYDAWWLDERYGYNMIPFQPKHMTPEELRENCVAARAEFYRWRSILRRSVDGVNRSDPFMFRNFFVINRLLRGDVSARDHYPLGDLSWHGRIQKAESAMFPFPVGSPGLELAGGGA